jgi:hypothetical protein
MKTAQRGLFLSDCGVTVRMASLAGAAGLDEEAWNYV